MIETKKPQWVESGFSRQRQLAAKTSLRVCETAQKIRSITWDFPLLQTSLDQNMFIWNDRRLWNMTDKVLSREFFKFGLEIITDHEGNILNIRHI